jgi:transposase
VNTSNRQRAIRAYPRKVRAVQLCQAGLSNQEIAEELHAGESTVSGWLKEYWENRSRLECDFSTDELDMMRTRQAEDLETARQRILTQLAILDKSKAINYSAEERCVIATAV